MRAQRRKKRGKKNERKKEEKEKKIPERKRGVSGSRSCLSINKAWFLK